MSSEQSTASEHPDELALVAWGEQRLLGFEREAVETHLASCEQCRQLAASLELELSAPGVLTKLPSITRETGTGWGKGWSVVLGAALFFLMTSLVARWRNEGLEAPVFELALAGTRAETFAVQRSAPLNSDEFYIGVRLTGERWVRLMAFDDQGALLEIPIDPEGVTTASYTGASDHVFGPYPLQLGENQRVHTVIALASPEALDWSVIESAGWTLHSGSVQWQALADKLGAQLESLPVR